MATTKTRKLDELVDRAANRLQELADDAAAGNGFGARFADDLADDAAFLRNLKPSLIAARWRGEPPPAEAPDQPQREPAPQASTRNPKPKSKPKKGGVNPIIVIGAAFAIGLFAAHVIDWRSHAHPRD